MQLDLTCDGQNKRPSKRSDEILRAAATRLVKEMVSKGLIEQEDAEDSVAQIARASRYNDMDGYHLARELDDRYGWDCDMQMVEALDEFHWLLDAVHLEAEKKWAAENPREPKFSEGDTVQWHGEDATIHGIYDSRPQYYKVRQGEMSGGPNSYYVVPFEDVT